MRIVDVPFTIVRLCIWAFVCLNIFIATQKFIEYVIIMMQITKPVYIDNIMLRVFWNYIGGVLNLYVDVSGEIVKLFARDVDISRVQPVFDFKAFAEAQGRTCDYS